VRFRRTLIEPQSREALRAVGARNGWLIETTTTLRVGFGGVAASITLNDLDEPTDAVALLRAYHLSGDDGPTGTGVVAFGSLPFDRNAGADSRYGMVDAR